MKLTRRHALIGGAGVVGAAGLIGGGKYVSWQEGDYTSDAFNFADIKAAPDQKLWKNWAGNQIAVTSGIAVPASEQELADIITKSDRPVRPVGSGHSWSAVVPTEGTIVDLSRFSGLISVDKENLTATIGAGTKIGQAARLLAEHGLAFANLPDINQQSLAGAYSTATHGTGRDLPAMHDEVVGFRIVTGSGDIIDVDANNNPELFEAGKVSLGALGIITQYTLKLKPSFLLHRKVWMEDIHQLLDRAGELVAKHPFFEFFYFHNVGLAAVMVHDYFDGEPTDRDAPDDDQVLDDLKRLRNELGWWPWMRRRTFASEFPDGELMEETKQESWKLLSTPRPTRIFETEYHVPIEEGLEAFREMLDFVDARPSFYVPSEFRYVRPDSAWLSPFSGGVRNSISFHTPVDEDYSLHKDVIEPMMLKHGGHPHWGKLHSLKYGQLKSMYPKLDAFRELRRELDPNGRLLNDHLRDLLGESDL